MKRIIVFLLMLGLLFFHGTVFGYAIWDGSIDPSVTGFSYVGDSGSWHVNEDENGAAQGYTFLDSSYANVSYLRLDNSLAELNRSLGWSIEMIVKPLFSDGDFYGNVMAVEDDIGGINMFFGSGLLEVSKRDGSDKASYTITPDTFVNVGIEMAPGGTSADIYLNDLLITSIFADTQDTFAPLFVIGDGSSNSSGKMVFDQLQINSSPSAHTPEPATMFLLGSGLIGLVGFKRKFRKG